MNNKILLKSLLSGVMMYIVFMGITAYIKMTTSWTPTIFLIFGIPASIVAVVYVYKVEQMWEKIKIN